MLQLVQIFKSFKDSFDANAGLKGTVEELIAGWEKEGQPRNYGVFEITPGESDFDSGSLYVQHYLAKITIYNSQTISDAYTIGHNFYAVFNRYYKLTGLTEHAKTLEIIPLPLKVTVEDYDYDSTADIGTQIFKIECSWELLINEFLNT